MILKKYVVFIILSLFGIGYASSSFVSLHDDRFLSTLLANQAFLDGTNFVMFRKDYALMQHNEKSKEGQYYRPNGWLRFKYYIPAGTSARLVLAAMPNISMRIDLKYKGDTNNILDHIHPQPYRYVPGGAKNDPIYSDQEPTIKYIALNVFSKSAYNMDEGGWMYVCIVENDAEYAGEHGRIKSAQIHVDYSLKIIDRDKFNNWLFQTTFTHTGGDPVDSVEKLIEYDNVLENDKVVSVTREIALNTQGMYRYHPDTLGIANHSFSSSFSSSSLSSEVSNEEDISSFSASSSSVSQSSVSYQNVNTTQSTSMTTVTSVDDENMTNEEKENIQLLVSKSFPIKGYFIGVPSKTPRKWFYVVRETNEVYEFKVRTDNSSNGKRFQWKKVRNVFPVIRGNQIKFVSSKAQASYMQSSTSSSISLTSSGSITHKECVDGYSFDPVSGICRQSISHHSSSSKVSYQHSSIGSAGGSTVLPSPAINQGNTSQQKRSCAIGYHYNPHSGLCQPN